MEYFLPFLLSGILAALFAYHVYENETSNVQMKHEVLATTYQIQQEVKSIKTDIRALQQHIEVLSMKTDNVKWSSDDLTRANTDIQNTIRDIASKSKETSTELKNLLNADGMKKVLMPSYSTRIAFHVRLSKSITSINKFQTIVFDHVVLDSQNAYNVKDGKFTVLVTGIYIFYWNLMTNNISVMDTALYSTEGVLGYGFVDRGINSYSNGGNMVIAQLTKGSQIWLNKADSYGQYLHERFSTFSGVLLFDL